MSSYYQSLEANSKSFTTKILNVFLDFLILANCQAHQSLQYCMWWTCKSVVLRFSASVAARSTASWCSSAVTSLRISTSCSVIDCLKDSAPDSSLQIQYHFRNIFTQEQNSMFCWFWLSHLEHWTLTSAFEVWDWKCVLCCLTTVKPSVSVAFSQ
jgi:hypothetical protein